MQNAIAQIVKTAAKTNVKAAPKKPVTKAATKPRVMRAAKTKVPAGAPAAYTLEDFARPQAGRNLFAFTQAWLEMTGLVIGTAIPKDVLQKVCGDTAVPYHIKKGNIEMTASGLILTEKGKLFFGERTAKNEYDQSTVDVFKGIMQTGKADGVFVKAQHGIKRIA